MAASQGPQKAWGGVFREPTDKRVEAFSESVSFDRRLADDDIDGSIAHARMLAACGLMTVPEADAISQTLEEIRRQIADGQFEFTAAKEDIHLHIEAALTARLGDAGRKLHTARSRNDQAASGDNQQSEAVHGRNSTEGRTDILNSTPRQRAMPVE